MGEERFGVEIRPDRFQDRGLRSAGFPTAVRKAQFLRNHHRLCKPSKIEKKRDVGKVRLSTSIIFLFFFRYDIMVLEPVCPMIALILASFTAHKHDNCSTGRL